uniref:Small ribosomal subunit protein uS3c n=1 Tax=Gracilaria vermiculophylla TaxID=2608709 RepID=A0A345U936_9FLOR|nr:ribosomal protein S3 [Gracilaria vermiculophylla]AXI96972.1 ribosomal protein S3 [Gracilaria vermiculophylla]QXU75176.1 ribosomal protein S3 [Gracilaria vermiculophylla]WDZ67950.1 ribosomal protein S3 [Gracilaria vermiculophylla]
MGQKTHPLGFRIGITQAHKSSWFSKMKSYPELAQEDYKIRNFIEKQLYNASIALIYIDRKVDQIQIHIHTARPGIILGKMGNGLENIRKNLENILTRNIQIRINLIEITDPDKEAALIAEFIVQQLEKRIAFRRVIRQAVQRSQKAKNQGIKIQISGRLNGAEIARSEWVREGRVPLQTLRANIDYSYKTAHTIYGILGVKVWLFKGEKIITHKIQD